MAQADTSPPGAALELHGAGDVFTYVAGTTKSPVVCSFPHVGLEWPDALGRRPQVNVRKNADLAVEFVSEGLTVPHIRARYSRLVVDLNRASLDLSPALCPSHGGLRPRRDPGDPASAQDRPPPGHRGVIWDRSLANVTLLSRPLDADAFHRRIAAYHTPYWSALQTLLDQAHARHGVAMLLDIHSMPSSVTPDIVVSTRRGSSAAADTVEKALQALSCLSGLDIRVDDPYAGGAITSHFGRPEAGFEALQVEINRRLYLDEHRLQLLDPMAPTTPHRRRAHGLSPTDVRRALLGLVEQLTGHLLNRCAA